MPAAYDTESRQRLKPMPGRIRAAADSASAHLRDSECSAGVLFSFYGKGIRSGWALTNIT